MLINEADPRQPDAAAVRATVSLTALISPADLARPTPCAGWDLRALLAHMTAQHRGFAAAAVGRGADASVWLPDLQDQEPVPRYAQSAADVISAFRPDDVLDRGFHLPEISDRPLPARMAIGFHLVDYVVHGWDVAATLDVPFVLPPEVLTAALPIARVVPDGENRRRPGAAFAPSLPAPDAPDPLTEILTLLGRSPAWPRKSVGAP